MTNSESGKPEPDKSESQIPGEVRNRAVRGISQDEIAELEARLIHTDCLSGLYYPTAESDLHSPVAAPATEGQLPVPPQALWHWYGDGSEKSYLLTGKGAANNYRDAARQNGFSFAAGKRMLDFGCSGGRVIRWFEPEARDGMEVWGCDIDAAAIHWCEKNLMPPLRFFTNTTAPHLPVRDGFFDFMYAGSVFTHIKDMAGAWLLELARCLSKDGLAVFTVSDEHSLVAAWDEAEKKKGRPPETLKNSTRFVVENQIDEKRLKEIGFGTFATSPWWTGAMYHSSFFKRRASLAFEVVDIRPNMLGRQTGYVLRPRS